MNPDVNTLRQQAYEANSTVGNMEAAAPTLLAQLKQNLVGIFAKDNPIINARNNAVVDYLNAPSASRVSVLPGNMPTVEGRPLALSPTQQNAITTSQSNAALVPAVGLNQLVTGQYGNLADIIAGAGQFYNASINGERSRASGLLDLYKTAAAEEAAKLKSGGEGIDIASIIAALNQTEQPNSGLKAADFYQKNGGNTQVKQQPSGTNPVYQWIQSLSQPNIVSPIGGEGKKPNTLEQIGGGIKSGVDTAGKGIANLSNQLYKLLGIDLGA